MCGWPAVTGVSAVSGCRCRVRGRLLPAPPRPCTGPFPLLAQIPGCGRGKPPLLVNALKVAASGGLNLEHVPSMGCLSILVLGTPHALLSFLWARAPAPNPACGPRAS